MSTLEVNKITPQGTGTEITLGDSGDTFTIPSGVTLNGSSATLTGFATTNGITEADIWRLTTNFTGAATPINANWERCDNNSFGRIGTGMTESSGIFTFPSTGIWWIIYHFQIHLNDSADNQVFGTIVHSPDNGSTLDVSSYGLTGDGQTGNRNTHVSSSFFDITNTSTHTVQFWIESQDAGNTTRGATAENQTWVEFIRLGDT